MQDCNATGICREEVHVDLLVTAFMKSGECQL